MNVEIVDYNIVADIGKDALEREVKKQLKNGWQPIGGVSTMSYLMNSTTGQIAFVYSQAMVKYKSE